MRRSTETNPVAPVWGRGLKCIETNEKNATLSRPRMGAWIEIVMPPARFMGLDVAPVWGRGLKLGVVHHSAGGLASPPYGGVD